MLNLFSLFFFSLYRLYQSTNFAQFNNISYRHHHYHNHLAACQHDTDGTASKYFHDLEQQTDFRGYETTNHRRDNGKEYTPRVSGLQCGDVGHLTILFHRRHRFHHLEWWDGILPTTICASRRSHPHQCRSSASPDFAFFRAKCMKLHNDHIDFLQVS